MTNLADSFELANLVKRMSADEKLRMKSVPTRGTAEEMGLALKPN